MAGHYPPEVNKWDGYDGVDAVNEPPTTEVTRGSLESLHKAVSAAMSVIESQRKQIQELQSNLRETTKMYDSRIDQIIAQLSSTMDSKNSIR